MYRFAGRWRAHVDYLRSTREGETLQEVNVLAAWRFLERDDSRAALLFGAPRGLDNSASCSMMRFSMSPRAQYSACGDTASAGSEVTTKRGLEPVGEMFGLADDPALPAPTVARAVAENPQRPAPRHHVVSHCACACGCHQSSSCIHFCRT